MVKDVKGMERRLIRKGKFQGMEATHLRRGERDLEEKVVEIQLLKKELEAVLKTNNSGLDVSAAGNKGAFKELKEAKFETEIIQRQLIEESAEKRRLIALLEIEKNKLDKNDPHSRSSEVRPQFKASIDAIQILVNGVLQEQKVIDTKVTNLEASLKGLERDESQMKLTMDQLRMKLANENAAALTTEDAIIECRNSIKTQEEWREELSLATSARDLARDEKRKAGIAMYTQKTKLDRENQIISKEVATIETEGSIKLSELEQQLLMLNKSSTDTRTELRQTPRLASALKAEFVNQEKLLEQYQEISQVVEVRIDHLTQASFNTSFELQQATNNFELLSRYHQELVAEITSSVHLFKIQSEQKKVNGHSRSESTTNLESELQNIERHSNALRKEIQEENLLRLNLIDDEQKLKSREIELQALIISQEVSRLVQESNADIQRAQFLENRMFELSNNRKEFNQQPPSNRTYLKTTTSSTSSAHSKQVVHNLIATVKKLNFELTTLQTDNIDYLLQLGGLSEY